MKKDITDIAVIFKKIITQNVAEYIPIKAVYGTYSDGKFIDTEKVQYSHIITGVENYGFCFRDSIDRLEK